ncbi:MAG: hypothetical protein R3F14_14735, partial [Polyangiaceae bacterium]
MTDSMADELVAEAERKTPAAVGLARLASLAVRVEPELLRALRLALLPGASVSAETDLWFSALVQARSPSRMILLPEVVARLREGLPAADIESAYGVIRHVHRSAPSILRLEEEIVYHALRAGGGADVERSLQSVVAAMEDPSRRENLAAWALRALPQLPSSATEVPSYWSLLLASGGLHPAGAAPLDSVPPSALHARMDGALLKAIGSTRVAVEWGGGVLRLRRAVEGDAATIPAPATHPVVVEVRAAERVQAVILREATWVETEMPGEVVQLKTIDGSIHEVRRARQAAAVHEGAEQAGGAQEGAPQEGTAEQPRAEVPEAWWSGCVQIRAGQSMQSGYLLAPDLVATTVSGLESVIASGSYPEVLYPQEGSPTEERRKAFVLYTDEQRDLALLRLSDPPLASAAPYEIGPGIGEDTPWAALGFEGSPPSHESPATNERPERRAVTGRGAGPPGDWQVLARGDGEDTLGMVGGPLLVDGRVCGHIRGPESPAALEEMSGGMLICPADMVRQAWQLVTDRDTEITRLATSYDEIRETLPWGSARTARMTLIRREMESFATSAGLHAWQLAELAASDSPGRRLLAIAAAIARPAPAEPRLRLLRQVLTNPRSRFEQYSALLAGNGLVDHLSTTSLVDLRGMVEQVHSAEYRHTARDTDIQALSQYILQRIDRRLQSNEHPQGRDLKDLWSAPGTGLFGDAAVEHLRRRVSSLEGSGVVWLVGHPLAARSRLLRRWAETLPQDGRGVVGCSIVLGEPEATGKLARTAARMFGGARNTPFGEDLALQICARQGIVILDGVDNIQPSRVPAIRDFLRVFRAHQGSLCLVGSSAWLPDLHEKGTSPVILSLGRFPRDGYLVRSIFGAAPQDREAIVLALSPLLQTWGADVTLLAASSALETVLRWARPDEPWTPLYEALQATRAWLDCPCDEHAFRASDAATEIDLAVLRARGDGRTLTASAHLARATSEAHEALTERPDISSSILADVLSPALLADVLAVCPSMNELREVWAGIRRALLGEPPEAPPGTGHPVRFSMRIGLDRPFDSGAIESFLRTMTGDPGLSLLHATELLTFTSDTGHEAFQRIARAYRAGGLTHLFESRILWLAERSPPPDRDDPQKGRWGDLPERDGLLLSARVEKNRDGWFAVELAVSSTDPERPLTGQVVFYLHTDFEGPAMEVQARDG